MADVDDLAIWIAAPSNCASADEKARNFFDRFLRRGQTDALQRIFRERGKTFNAQREMRAAAIVDDGVNFIHDERAHGAEHLAAGFGREQQIKGFRRRNEDVRRFFDQGLACAAVVSPVRTAARTSISWPCGVQHRADFGERFFEIFMDVVAQRFERRDVNNLGFVRQIGLEAFAKKGIERGQKRGERFAGASRRGDERVRAGLNRRPAAQLRFGGRSERLLEPRATAG